MRAEDFAVLDVDLNISRAPITKKFFDRCDEAARYDAVRDLEPAHRLEVIRGVFVAGFTFIFLF